MGIGFQSPFAPLPTAAHYEVVDDLSSASLSFPASFYFIEFQADGWPKLAVARRHWDHQSLKEMEHVAEVVQDKAVSMCEAAIQKAQ